MAIPKLHSYSLKDITLDIQNRTNWQVEPDRAALLIHDMQQYFVDFYEDKQMIEIIIGQIKSIKEACVAAGIPVFYTAQPGNQSPDDRALLTDFWGQGIPEDPKCTQVVSELAPKKGDLFLKKCRYSAFKRSDLELQLKNNQINQLIIVGVYAHIGCMLTAAEAFMNDIQVFMVADALGDFSREDHLYALNYVAKRCGSVTTTEKLLCELQAYADSKLPRSKQQLKEQVAELLEINVTEIIDEDNLIDLGLDSIRTMNFLSDWQHRGLDISFTDVAKSPSINTWWQLLQTARRGRISRKLNAFS
ncbi:MULTISPECIES: isochorismatase family protein [Photorhabdus]|uniref:isochorismatase n=1 Tax=Photorhabdus bodei TaxID=2029681 RepID=A0AAW6BQP7_9GAMM|nr:MULTISPECIES: isochorismatase family protein [Photorhabdus]MCT8353541.1 isochorismatase family protein [Photorhabdus kayaii]MDB6375048.1 isochorismatase family protein [Photorhabdus bodei]